MFNGSLCVIVICGFGSSYMCFTGSEENSLLSFGLSKKKQMHLKVNKMVICVCGQFVIDL